MPTQRITYKDWLPDQPSVLDAVSEANNVIPLAVGYGPFKSSVEYSQAASENLNNVFSAKLDNDVTVFAGGLTKLYILDTTDLTLDDISKTGGYTGDSRWYFTQFGSYVLGVNGSEKIQAYDLLTSTAFDDLNASAPIAKYIAIVRDFVVGANIDAGTYSNRVQWSDINDATDWTPGAASQSDYQDLPDGGDITGITGGEFGLVFLEKAIVRMSYIGSPLFFQFDTISRNIGCIEAGSIAQYGGITYFLSDDGFYSCDGQNLVGIGDEKVDRFFFSNANIGDIDTISAAVDPERNLVIWNYTNVAGGRSLLIYNYAIQKWSSADTDVSYLSTLATSGTSLDGIDSAYNVNAGSFVVGKQYTIRTVGTTDFTLIGAVANTVGVLFTATGAGTGTGVAIDMAASAAGLKTLDTIVTNLDDRLYKGGKFLFGGVKDTKIITFTGTYTTANLTTNDIEYGYNSVVTLIRPSVDNGSADVAIASRKMLNDTITYGTTVSASEEDRCPVRSAGRYHRISLTPTGVNWSSAIGIDIDYSEQGSR
jgi:hypothetical protein